MRLKRNYAVLEEYRCEADTGLLSPVFISGKFEIFFPQALIAVTEGMTPFNYDLGNTCYHKSFSNV